MMDYFLTLLILSPLLGMLILLFVPHSKHKALKAIGLVATLLPLALCLILVAQYDFEMAGLQFVEEVNWVSFDTEQMTQAFYAINYELGVDGLSVVLLLLTTIVSSIAAIASFHIHERLKEYFLLFLTLQIGMMGVFASTNFFLFFVFFELTLIPMFFLISMWGYTYSERAAWHFLIYNGLGSAVMFIAILVLFFNTGTFNFEQMAFVMSLPATEAPWLTETLRMGLFLSLLFAFGIKLPIFPLHRWMLKVHVEAHPAIVMIHAGILLKLGAYGLIRINMTVFPDMTVQLAQFLAILGVINILYGAVLAFVQKDLKLVLAYSSVSHMGIILLGIAALNVSGLQGAIFQAVSHGFISALLFFMILVVYERTKTTKIDELGGLAKSMPIASGVFLAAGMANLGLPGMSGFISEFLAFLGLFQTYPVWAAIGVLGIILTAAYLLRAIMNATFGETPEQWMQLKDLRGFEYIPVVALLFFIILIGVYPSILADPLHDSVDTIVQSLMTRIGG